MVFGLEEELEMRSRASGPPFISPLSRAGPNQFYDSRGFPTPSSASNSDALVPTRKLSNVDPTSMNQGVAEPSRLPYQYWEATRGEYSAAQSYLSGENEAQEEIAELRAALNEALERAEAAEAAAGKPGSGIPWVSQSKHSLPELMRQYFSQTRGGTGGIRGARKGDAEASDSSRTGDTGGVDPTGDEARPVTAAGPAAELTRSLERSDAGCAGASTNATSTRAADTQEAGGADWLVWPYATTRQPQTSEAHELEVSRMELQLPRIDAQPRRRRFSSRR